MKECRKIGKKYIALLIGVYIFVAFFSAHFHHHGSAEVYKVFQFKKADHSVSTTDHHAENTDCLSCHLLYKSGSLLPEFYEFNSLQLSEYHTINLDVVKRLSFGVAILPTLRGPPSLV